MMSATSPSNVQPTAPFTPGQSGTPRRPGSSGQRSRAFTLTELLVVIGIILVLAGIALPLIIRSYRSADRTKVAGDLQAITAGLNAYKADFGDIPRTPRGTRGLGPAVLTKALLGPGGVTPTVRGAWATGVPYRVGELVENGGSYFICIQTIPTSGGNAWAPTTNANYWSSWSNADGFDGPGFKVRATSGEKWGPYIEPDKFTIRGGYLANRDDQIYLYYPAAPTVPNLSAVPSLTNGGYVASALAQPTWPLPLWNSDDNTVSAMTTNELRVLLGDYNVDGASNALAGQEPAPLVGAFLLIAPGPDGGHGPSAVDTSGTTTNTTRFSRNKSYAEQCDDILNLTR